MLYNCITSVRISALFENRDPRAARSNKMHEWTSQLKHCRTTIFHNHTGMVWYKLTNRYRGSVFLAHPVVHSHKFCLHICWLLWFAETATNVIVEVYIKSKSWGPLAYLLTGSNVNVCKSLSVLGPEKILFHRIKTLFGSTYSVLLSVNISSATQHCCSKFVDFFIRGRALFLFEIDFVNVK